MNLTKHLTINELSFSATALRLGIDNSIQDLYAAFYLAIRFEQLRKALGNKPLKITSGYRSTALNNAIGGSIRSDHMSLLAVDIRPPSMIGTLTKIKKLKYVRYAYENSSRSIHVSFHPLEMKK